MAKEPTLPSESTPPQPNADHVALTGSASVRSMANGGLTHTSDTPAALKSVDTPPPPRTGVDAAILSNWDQPQPQQPSAFQSNAFQGAAAVQVEPTPSAGTAPQFSGNQATGSAGDLSVSIQNDAPPGGVIMVDSPTDRYAELQARVALLESSISEIKRQKAPPVDARHNQGPPLEDLDDYSDLIALLKDRGPNDPIDKSAIISQIQKVEQTSSKLKQWLIDYGGEMAKGAARELGKLAVLPALSALVYWADEVIRYFISFF